MHWHQPCEKVIRSPYNVVSEDLHAIGLLLIMTNSYIDGMPQIWKLRLIYLNVTTLQLMLIMVMLPVIECQC